MKDQWFTIPGNPVGYYAQGKQPNWARKKKYEEYKQHVQICAMAAGVKLPLVATRDRPLIISTASYFASGVHCDPENVRKGVADALFYTPPGSGSKGSADKYTGGAFPPPRYDPDNPRVEVSIEYA